MLSFPKKLRYNPKTGRVLLIAMITLFSLSFFIDPRAILLLAFFSIANSLLLSIDRYVNITHDLELSTFSSVLFSYQYGLYWGISAALLTKISEIIYNKSIVVDDIFAIFAFILAAIMGYLFRSIDIAVLGIIVTIAINIFNYFISKYFAGISGFENVSQVITNVILNFILFTRLAKPLLFIM